jgi:hypothetical protein
MIGVLPAHVRLLRAVAAVEPAVVDCSRCKPAVEGPCARVGRDVGARPAGRRRRVRSVLGGRPRVGAGHRGSCVGVGRGHRCGCVHVQRRGSRAGVQAWEPATRRDILALLAPAPGPCATDTQRKLAQLARVDELPAYAHARPARKVRRYHDAPLAAPARLLRRPAPPSLATLHGRTQVSKGCRVTGIQGIRTGRFASADSRASCGHGERRPRIRPSGRAGRLPCRS